MIITMPTLAKALRDCRYALDTLGQVVARGDVCSKEDFMKAAKAEDINQVNDYLQRAIVGFTGNTNIVKGLRRYCAKFGIALPKEEKSAEELLLLINDNAPAIQAKFPATNQ